MGVTKAINRAIGGKDSFLTTLQGNIEMVLGEQHDQTTSALDEKLDELQNELLRLANSKADYENVANEIYRLRELKQNTLDNNAVWQGKRQRIEEMHQFLQGQSTAILEYEEKLVRRLVERITVFEEHLEVQFKSSVEFDIEICAEHGRQLRESVP